MSWAEQPHILEDGQRIPRLRPLGSNPSRGVALNQEERRQRFLTPAEIARLIAALDQRRAKQDQTSVALVKFLLLTGARFSEGARADWSQFDLDAGTWTKPASFTKQKRMHSIPLAGPTLALLQQLRGTGTSNFLFPGRDGHRPLTKVSSLWRSVTRDAGLEGVRVHDLRHSFAALLASGGASLLLIGELLGHTQSQTTHRYSHLLDAVQRAAVEKAGAVIAGGSTAEVIDLPKSQRR
jgi:integrase